MIRTFLDALPQRLGQSIMRKTKQSVKVHTKLLTLLLLLLTIGVGNVWGETYTLDYSTQSKTDVLFPVASTFDQYKYDSNSNVAGWNLLDFDESSSIIVTNITGATITEITVSGLVDNNSNKSTQITISDGVNSINTGSSPWNNRKSTSLTEKTLSNVNTLNMTAGTKYTISTTYHVGIKITITYSPSSSGPTHTLTVTSEDESKGTAVATQTEVGEGATTIVTATSKSGYMFDHWSVTGAGSSLSSTTTNPTTFTMGTEDATVTAYFVERICPSSGEIYKLTVKSATYKVPAETETNMESDYATVEEGTAYIGSVGDKEKAQIKTDGGGTVYFSGADGYIKLVLDCPLKTGDVLNFTNGSGSNQICFTTDKTRATTHATTNNTFTFPEAFNEKSTIYVWRASGNSTYLHDLTITRPAPVVQTTITLSSQGGTGGTASVTATKGEAMPAITIPSRTGYNFQGYFTANGGTGTKYYNADGTSAQNWDKEDATFTLIAYWTAKTTNVTLNANGGTGGTASVTATYNAAMPTITPATLAGYALTGYFDAASGGVKYYNANGTSAKQWDKEAATTTLYAQWECTAPTNVVISGEYIRFPGETLTLTVSGENITGDATYTWKKGDQVIAGQTTATLTINNATITDAGNYKCTISNGGGCEATTDFTVKMYSLRGLIDWSTDCAFTKVNATTATYSMELTASSSYEFKIFDGSAYYGKEGDDLTMTSSNCTNWTMKENSGSNVTLQTTAAGTYTFTLDYTDASNPTISVTYPQKKMVYFNPDMWDADGTTEVYTVYSWQEGSNGSFVTMTSVEGCGNTNIYQAEIDASHNKLLFIRWNQAHIAWDNNRWNQSIDLDYQTNGQYKIDDWGNNSDLYWKDGAKKSWASHEKTFTPNYIVTFNTNGHGTAPEAQCVAKNGKAITPAAPTATGYTFGGWYKEAGCTNAYDFNTEVTSDITLYAKWIINTYTVTYVVNSPTKYDDSETETDFPAQTTVTVNAGGTIILPNPSIKIETITVYNAKWKDASDNEYSGGAEITPTGDMTLTAQWTPQSWKIGYYESFDGTNLGTEITGLTPNQYTYGVETSFCANAETIVQQANKTGYTWLGWWSRWSPDAQNPVTTATAGYSGEFSLFAKWTENTPEPTTYTVTVTPPTNGTISASKTTGINEGETITLTVTPASGYQLETLTVKDASDNTVTVTDNKFTMPASNVTVSATFTEISTGGGGCEKGTVGIITTTGASGEGIRTMQTVDNITVTHQVVSTTSGAIAEYTKGDKQMYYASSTAIYSKGAYKWNVNTNSQDIETANNTVGYQVDVADGFTYSLSTLEFKIAASCAMMYKIAVCNSTETLYSSEEYTITNYNKATATNHYQTIDLSGVNKVQNLSGTFVVKVYLKFGGTGKYLCFPEFTITGDVCPTCTAPATPLDVSVADNEITVGGTTTITTTGGNGSAVTLTANGGTIVGNTYTAPATPGTYTITATQPKNGEQCAGEATCTITVNDLPNAQVYDLALNKDNVCAEENATLTLSGSQSGVNYQLYKDGVASGAPVAGTGNALTWTVTETATYTVKSVANATYKETTMIGTPKLTVTNTPTITITGQGTVTQGEAVTLTATAAGATSFEWFRVDSETTNGGTSVANTATYTPTTDAEGTYYYYCVATNSCGSDKLCVAVVVKAPDGTCGTIPSTGATVTLTNGVILHSANSDGRQVDTDYIKEQDVTGDSDKERTYNSGRYVLKMPADVERLIVYAYREGTARDLKGVKISPTFGPNAEDVAYVNADCSYETSGSQPNYIYEITFNTPVTVGQYVFLNFSDAMYFWQICYVSSCEDLVPTVTPRAAVLCEDGAVTLTATNYTADATLQWYKDGVEITGATTDTYTASEAGVYTFGANKICERISNEVTVVAAQTPVIETQPTNASTAAGVTNSDIFVKATGATSYQWYTCDQDGGNPVIIAGQTAATLNVTHELPGTYYYKVVVIGGCDLSVTSTVASLEVVEGACFSMVVKKVSGVTLNNEEQMTETMADITGGTVVADGSNMSFNQYSVPNENRYLPEIILKNYLKVTLASGSIGKGTVIRVKYRNGSSVSGRGVQILKTDKTVIHSFTNNTSTLTEETYEVTADMDVSEFYIGRATSNTTYLSEVEILGCVTPCEKPIITTQPVGNNYCKDTEWDNRESLSVTVAPVTDGGTLSYQWYKDGEEIDGATSTTYIPSESGQYYCIVTNTLEGNTASTTSNEVTVFNQQQDVTLTWNFKTGNRPHATQNSTTSLISNLTDITATGVNVSSDAKGDRTVKFATVADESNETDGATFSFDVEELYDFTPSTISMKVATVATTFPIHVTIKDEIGQTITGAVTPTAADKETDVNFTTPIVKWMGKVTVLVQGIADGAEFRLFGDVTISGAVECGCTPPEMAWKQCETEVTEITVGYTAANFYEFPTLTNPGGLEVTYASTDENVATVDAMGVVTPRNNGTTVISAKYVGDANQGICPITVTYVLTIVCDDDQPMITTSVANPLDCNDVIPLQLVASDGVTPISSGFVQWYRDGVAIQGATEYTYEAGRSGTYTATLQVNCLQTTSNSAVVTNKQTEPTVTKLVSQQKIRNNGLEDGQRPYASDLKYSLFEVTPTNTVDYTGPKWKATAMIHYQNGDLEDLGEVTWMREDATTATSITLGADFYKVSQVVLNKSLQKGDAIYVTVAPANACDIIDKFIMDSIPILVTDRYSLAYIITGTVDGGFFDVDAEPLADPVFTLLQDYYDVTAVNGYAPFDLNNYEPFDLVLLTDYPKTSSHETYISALAGLVDKKPMLTFKAHMSGVPGWTEKGFLGNPVVPGCEAEKDPNEEDEGQTHLHVLCYAHDMFQGVGLTDINGDGVAEELEILTGVAKDGNRWKGMQGFTASDASNFVNIATVHNGTETSTEQLIACCERQEVVDARFMMLSINNLSTKFIGGDGTKVIANILEYLLHSDPTAVSDCSLVFDDNNGTGVWSDRLNWAPAYNMVPGRYHNVRIDRPCKVDQLAAVALVKVRKDTKTTAPNGQTGYWQGSLTVQPGKKLTVFGEFGKVEDNNFMDITPLQGNYNDLVIETDADAAGAFAIDPDANSQENAPDATIKFYSQGTGAVAGSEDPSQALWHYMAIPTTGVQMAVTPFSGAWVCRWDEQVPNASNYPQAHWYVVHEEDQLIPFEGYALTQANPTTYTIKGRINVGNPTIESLTYTPVSGDNSGDRTDEQSRTYPKAYPGFNLLGNSYTAPIKLSAIPESAFSTNLQKTIYIYNAGTWAEWYGEGTPGSVVPEDGTSKTPGQYLALPLNANLGDGALKWIPAMQGFFVRVIGDGSATISGEKIDIDYLNMVVQPNYDDLETPPVPRAPQKPGKQKVDPNQSLMKMTVKGKRFADNLYLLIQDECSHEFDNGWDGDKIYGNARTPQLFAIEKYGPMAVNTVDDINGQSIGFFAGEDSEYTISYDPTEMREHYTQLYLHDMTTGAVTDMFAQNEYTFSVGKQGEVRRFVISTSPDPHWDTSDGGLLRAWAADEMLYVENFTDSEGDYTVFDAAGRRIAYGHLPALGRYSFQLKLIPGAYTVNVRTNSIVKPVKVIF